LNEKTVAFLKNAYKEYYFRRADSIGFPEDVQTREFGYIPFAGGMVRHLAFRNAGEATAEILRQAPSSVYCSNARYDSPSLTMEEKGWKGAELIFDIDATDIPTPCKKGHDVWYCRECHATGRLPKPPACPTCRGPTEILRNTCDVCLEAAKNHALRVVDFLTSDFGTSARAIDTYFSGNRGYHLYVRDPRFEPLDQLARGEIADYVRGSALPSSQTIWATLKRMGDAPPDGLRGWTRRIASLSGTGPTQTGRPKTSIALAISSQSARIDSAVTTDIHRVFRLAGTLHGSSGMLKMKVGSFEAFDPNKDPVVLSGEKVIIKVAFYPKFSMMDESFGPYSSQTVALPAYAAICILARGFAEVI
jgi:DNA primase small subunit